MSTYINTRWRWQWSGKLLTGYEAWRFRTDCFSGLANPRQGTSVGLLSFCVTFLRFKSKRSVHRLTKNSALNPLHNISASVDLCCFGASGVNYSLLIRIRFTPCLPQCLLPPAQLEKLVCTLPFIRSSLTPQELFAPFKITE